jgi:carotenoid cleavage dioxygenase
MPPRQRPGRSGRITVVDLDNGDTRSHLFAADQEPGEAVFAPADNQPGGPGWLLAYVYVPLTERTELVVLDADNPQDDPVAVIHLPTRVPHGFHGTWLAD